MNEALIEVARQLGRLADANFRAAKASERIATISEQNYETQKQLASTSQQLEQILMMAQGEQGQNSGRA